MTTKRRKPWWHLLRGPRGHRGLPGPTGADFSRRYDEVIEDLVHRVADLERKLGGSQK
jgi:hypothetical protein